MGHKDCPVSQSQGLNGMGMQQFIEGFSNQQMNPYGLQHMGAPPVMGPGQGMQPEQRRFS